MSVQMILLPLFVEVILTFVIWSWMAALRTRDFSSGTVRPEQIALREPNWPKRTMQFAAADLVDLVLRAAGQHAVPDRLAPAGQALVVHPPPEAVKVDH